ncbi:tyrosine--tRNA ligase [Candidatus Photodesmus blepharus]|uniref:tyrosine--tRNA ligase n=1 Tax=Candidatus Photodesmus blepharonis TaxID=1179155 RepID=UPI0005579A04|nr:tyrosine--tRNA ligase [Candidatus Photodesmus blepharus]
MANIKEALWEIKQGVKELISEEELILKLKKGCPLRVKLGADPTVPDIHLGHTVVFNKLRIFQEFGHEVIFLVGDFTAMVGDPSGKNNTRPKLSHKDVLKNAETYKEQVLKILDPEKTEIRFNSEWLSNLSAEDMILLASNQTVARMLERDDFKKRYLGGKPIFIHEFIYPLLQGHDSVVLRSDVELGGIDQKFNLLIGRELQKTVDQSPQTLLMMPLLVGLDGIKKMSKSVGNYIGINENPVEMFGKIMSISDRVMWSYYELLSFRSSQEISQLKADVSLGRNPRDIKILLAKEIVARFHNQVDACMAEREFINCFQKRLIPEKMPEFDFEVGLPISRILKEARLCVSTSDAIRMIKQGAVKIEGKKLMHTNFFPEPGAYVFQVGKRRFACIKIK